ncbi:MAG: DUF4286 family protein [Myxococcales bacterium]|nr:DUF4286 family protein [Myxococcales bacterium]
MSFAYTVIADFDSPQVAGDWVAWLKDGHLQAVLDGGARSVDLVRLEPTAEHPLRFEARYLFADLPTFQRYEQTAAPRLRADGLARFPPSRGVRLTRVLGEVLERLPG